LFDELNGSLLYLKVNLLFTTLSTEIIEQILLEHCLLFFRLALLKNVALKRRDFVFAFYAFSSKKYIAGTDKSSIVATKQPRQLWQFIIPIKILV
jgi:hypothetical protein